MFSLAAKRKTRRQSWVTGALALQARALGEHPNCAQAAAVLTAGKIEEPGPRQKCAQDMAVNDETPHCAQLATKTVADNAVRSALGPIQLIFHIAHRRDRPSRTRGNPGTGRCGVQKNSRFRVALHLQEPFAGCARAVNPPPVPTGDTLGSDSGKVRSERNANSLRT